MTDWAESKAIYNRGIKRETDSRILRELLKITLGPIVLAAVLFTILWERSQLVGIGYEGQQLQTREQALLRAQKALILEEETLKDPHRIDAVARNVLGMTPLRPHQLLSQTDNVLELNAPTRLALAGNTATGAEPRKAGLTN
jgi:cell division protein FtsL